MTGMSMGVFSSMSMMAAMMLPSAVPAIARRARAGDGVLAAPLFAGFYLGTWALVALAMCLLYRPGGGSGSCPPARCWSARACTSSRR
jgi:predicted metal-binding membrane protein